MGRNSTPASRTKGMTTSPAATRTSLLARAIVFPALIASTVGWRPITPATLTTTMSAFGTVAASTKPSTPDSSKSQVFGLPNLAACSARSARLERAARPTISKRSGYAETTSRVWVPMLPVEPSRTIRLRSTTRRVYFAEPPPPTLHPPTAIISLMPAALGTDTRFRLGEARAKELAEAYGTPLYVLDEGHFRARIKRYRAAAEAAHPNSEITFACKANSTLALLKIADSEGCEIDVASEGELRAALRAGVPASRCHLHGNNKQEGELRFAIDSGIGQIVADHFTELETLATMLEGDKTKVVLRLAPGVDPVTHAKISTGQADTKFGFNIADGSAEAATVRCLELGLPLIGFHCHVGSQLLDPEAQRAGGEHLAAFAGRMLKEHGFKTEHLNVGGS